MLQNGVGQTDFFAGGTFTPTNTSVSVRIGPNRKFDGQATHEIVVKMSFKLAFGVGGVHIGVCTAAAIQREQRAVRIGGGFVTAVTEMIHSVAAEPRQQIHRVGAGGNRKQFHGTDRINGHGDAFRNMSVVAVVVIICRNISFMCFHRGVYVRKRDKALIAAILPRGLSLFCKDRRSKIGGASARRVVDGAQSPVDRRTLRKAFDRKIIGQIQRNKLVHVTKIMFFIQFVGTVHDDVGQDSLVFFADHQFAVFEDRFGNGARIGDSLHGGLDHLHRQHL